MRVRTPHLLLVSQKVIDIKTALHLADLGRVIGELRDYLHKYAFIPGDKFTGELKPIGMDEEGKLSCELTGSSLGSTTSVLRPAIELTLPLEITDYAGELRIRDLLGAIKGTSIDDGGNIQNMLLNILVLTEALSVEYPAFNRENLQITVASSSDPFEKVDKPVSNRYRERTNIYPLSIADRLAVHFPYIQTDKCGIMAITSEPKQTYEPLLALLGGNSQFARAFRSATCFVSSDPFFQILPNHAVPPYAYIINASTAFRGLVAVSAYGNNALLPMNQGEAGEVCKLMLSRARGTDLDQTETPRFPSPLTIKEDALDPTSLGILDASIDVFSRHNPFFRQTEGFSFVCPISFGSEGGLIIGMNRDPIACFTSILSETGEQHLFNDYSFPRSNEIQETGAGDSVAAVVALFNAVSPEVIVDRYLQGREKTHKELRLLASTLFVSCLSRIVGNLLIRTPETNLTHIDTARLKVLIEEVAEECVKLACDRVKLLPDVVFGIVEKWGIKVAMWTPHRIFAPSTVTVTIE